MSRATSAERERLNHTFQTLCRIESPSGKERECADWVTTELESMGVELQEDDVSARVGSGAGNLLGRIRGDPRNEGDGDERGGILLCAHLDTVPLTAPVEPVVVDGRWENANEGILGADNKTAVAILIELARRLNIAPDPPPVPIELLFTVCEEVSLRGSKEFDITRLQSRFGYVFDHATPVGEIVLASPTHYRIDAELRGRAAHAGVRPEEGRSAIAAAARAIAAMRLGRVDPESTANVGTIAGGTSLNVVPERCRIGVEARSLDETKVQQMVTDMVDHLQDAANATECDLDVTVEQTFAGYRTRPKAPRVELAERALRACGYEPHHIVTGGASDANSFEAAGFPCLNLADGTERNHQPDERISVAALEGMFDVAIALVEGAAQ